MPLSDRYKDVNEEELEASLLAYGWKRLPERAKDTRETSPIYEYEEISKGSSRKTADLGRKVVDKEQESGQKVQQDEGRQDNSWLKHLCNIDPKAKDLSKQEIELWAMAERDKRHMDARGVFDEESNMIRARAIHRVSLWRDVTSHKPSRLGKNRREDVQHLDTISLTGNEEPEGGPDPWSWEEKLQRVMRGLDDVTPGDNESCTLSAGGKKDEKTCATTPYFPSSLCCL